MYFEHWTTFPILFLTGFSAGLVDAIAGGGGLISLPVLLSLGVPPTMALGTNKFQSSFGSFTASYHYVREQVVSLRDARTGIILTFFGAAAGAWVVQQVDNRLLSVIVPVALLVVALYTIFTPAMGLASGRAKMKPVTFYFIAGLVLGFYDGFFGPGVGTFWAIAFVVSLGFDLRKATGYTKVMNFMSNLASLILFIAGGAVLWLFGIIMAAGQIAGAAIGARLVIVRGSRFIRPVFLSIVILTILKLLYNRFGSM